MAIMVIKVMMTTNQSFCYDLAEDDNKGDIVVVDNNFDEDKEVKGADEDEDEDEQDDDD